MLRDLNMKRQSYYQEMDMPISGHRQKSSSYNRTGDKMPTKFFKGSPQMADQLKFGSKESMKDKDRFCDSLMHHAPQPMELPLPPLDWVPDTIFELPQSHQREIPIIAANNGHEIDVNYVSQQLRMLLKVGA